MSRDELKRRIDEATRKKMPVPKGKKPDSEERQKKHLESGRARTARKLRENGCIIIEGTDDVKCLECGRITSKHTSSKFRHYERCSYYDEG